MKNSFRSFEPPKKRKKKNVKQNIKNDTGTNWLVDLGGLISQKLI